MHIHLDWEGPYSYEEAKRFKGKLSDYGVYQIYGTHPIYGSDVLLYIGKADSQTFGVRLSQPHPRMDNTGEYRRSVYLGRLAGYEGTPSNELWSEQIAIAERMLIFAHWPAANASGLTVFLDERYHDVHIFNWGSYRNLLPEVSGSRYSNRYASGEGYAIYSSTEE